MFLIVRHAGEAAFTEEDVRAGVPQQELTVAMREGRSNDDRWMRRRDGECFFAIGSTTAIRDEAGNVAAFIKILRDDTVGRRTADENERLLQSERALHAEPSTRPRC
jgi:hypothetical protein